MHCRRPARRATAQTTASGGRTWRSTEVASHGAHAGASDTIQFLDRTHGWLVVQEPTAPFATLFATRDGGRHWHNVAGLQTRLNKNLKTEVKDEKFADSLPRT